MKNRGNCLFILLIIVFMIVSCTQSVDNPLLKDIVTPYGVPAFDKYKTEHYLPAFKVAIKCHKDEVQAIVNNPEEPTFENTIVALERSGSLLHKVEGVFFNILDADGNEDMDKIANEVSPLLSELQDGILLDDKLFKRIKTIYDNRYNLGLDGEDMRLLTETYKRFERNGATLGQEQKKRLMEINKELATLSLRFGQNVVSETNNYKLFITDEGELEGLPQSFKDESREDAVKAGRSDAWLFTAKKTSFIPVLKYCKNRELRKTLLMAYTTRCNHDNQYDNKAVINRTMRLRSEKAKMFGFDNAADYILQDCMAKNAKTVDAFLRSVWEPSLAAAKKEAAKLQQCIQRDIPGAKLEPWDWWYYAEKVRKAQYDLDEEVIKPYFELSNVRKGVFEVAHKLYGLDFEKLEGMPVYNPDVEVFKVTDADSSLIGIVYTDYFPRSGKRPGAWMNDICSQYIDADGVNHRPVIINVGNFNKPTSETPSLLSMDDVETLFHEFGHALHGLLSNCKYRSLSGTNTPRDFVELPSQFMENYCYNPQILRTYAKHYKTGEVIPDSLIEKINNTLTFNQGFITTELLSASILDMDYHELSSFDSIDVNAFESEAMEKMHMLSEIIVRYRSTFFNHIFTTGYEAGYYSYTWSAVLDADAFACFEETGDILNPQMAKKFRHMLEQGGTKDADALYLEFRGKEADPKYLLKRKGFLQ